MLTFIKRIRQQQHTQLCLSTWKLWLWSEQKIKHKTEWKISDHQNASLFCCCLCDKRCACCSKLSVSMLPEIKTSNGFVHATTATSSNNKMCETMTSSNNKMCETVTSHEASPMLGCATQIVITEADNKQTLLLSPLVVDTGNDSCCSSWFVSRDKNAGSHRRKRKTAFHQVDSIYFWIWYMGPSKSTPLPAINRQMPSSQ